MPKTTKRAATKKAARIERAHANDLPELRVRESFHRVPGEKRPSRGIARYPWAVTISLLLIALAAGSMYYYHVGPFAKPKPTPVVQVPFKPMATTACTTSALVKQVTDTAAPPTTAQFEKNQHTYSAAPAMSIDTHKLYCVGLNTNRGLIVLALDPTLAPKTVNNFVYLAQHHFYDGMKFHRVVPGFIIQSGDPKADGTGGPGYKFNDEPVKLGYTQGCVAMANSGANTNGSQFFICTADDSTKLQKQYNLFGRVVVGQDIANKIQGPGDDQSTKNIKPDTLSYAVVVAVNP